MSQPEFINQKKIELGPRISISREILLILIFCFLLLILILQFHILMKLQKFDSSIKVKIDL